MTIGKRISAARRKKGYTQEYIAQQLDVSRQAVSKWEKDLSSPDTGNLIRLAQLLDVSVDYLVTGKKSEPAKTQDFARGFYLSSLIPLLIMIVCQLVGLFSGEFTDMVTIPVSSGMRVGIPFLMYGHSPAAVALVILSAVCLLLFILLLFLGNYSNKDKK